MLDKLTLDHFARYGGGTFRLLLGPEQALAFELVETRPLPGRPSTSPAWRKPALPERQREPFSIVFRGPHSPALAQRMYTLVHEQMGTIEGLFLVPIDADEQGRYYEAIFA